MASRITVVPAYGRDYKSKQEVEAAWNAGTDFQIQDVSSRWNGSYINKEDAKAGGIREVNVRYKRLRSVTVIKMGTATPLASHVAHRHRVKSAANWIHDIRELDEVSRYIGGKIKSAIEILKAEMYEAKEKVNAVERAWSKWDIDTLVNEGVLTIRDAALLETIWEAQQGDDEPRMDRLLRQLR